MICPYCNTPNPDGANFCSECGRPILRKSGGEKSRAPSVLRAIFSAILLPMYYFSVINTLGVVWMVRAMLECPSTMDYDERLYYAMDIVNRDSAYLSMVGACVCLLTLALYFTLRRSNLFRGANVRRAPVFGTVAAFVFGLSVQLPVGVILTYFPLPDEVVDYHNSAMAACTSPLWVQICYAVIVAPIIEEVFFRGVVHDRLSKIMPVPLAALLSAAGFAVIHGDPLSIVVALGCGFVLALVYSRHKSVIVSIAFHMGFNLAGYAVGYIGEDPILTIALAFASAAVCVGSAYLLFRKSRTEAETDITQKNN